MWFFLSIVSLNLTPWQVYRYRIAMGESGLIFRGCYSYGAYYTTVAPCWARLVTGVNRLS